MIPKPLSPYFCWKALRGQSLIFKKHISVFLFTVLTWHEVKGKKMDKKKTKGIRLCSTAQPLRMASRMFLLVPTEGRPRAANLPFLGVLIPGPKSH